MTKVEKGYGNDGEPDARQKFEIEKLNWYGIKLKNIQSGPPKEVRGQSCTQRSLQKHVKMTSNYILVDGLG